MIFIDNGRSYDIEVDDAVIVRDEIRGLEFFQLAGLLRGKTKVSVYASTNRVIVEHVGKLLGEAIAFDLAFDVSLADRKVRSQLVNNSR